MTWLKAYDSVIHSTLIEKLKKKGNRKKNDQSDTKNS